MINQQLLGHPIFNQTQRRAYFLANTQRKQNCQSCLVRRAVLCVNSTDSLSNASFSAAFPLLRSGVCDKVGKGWFELRVAAVN